MEEQTKGVAEAPAVIEICGLNKSYGSNKALEDISFSVKKGEIMGFLGPNGAGKSTTMNILTGYLAASGGSVKIDGTDISENPVEVRRKIGYLPEQPPLYPEMTVHEYLSFAYDLKQVSRKDKEAHLNRIMETVKIRNVKGRLIKNLSKGYRQRVGLAQALIGDPEVLVLDEPTVGLDPKQIMEIREVISGLGKKRTVILSTHILQEVSAVCDSYTIINRGKIIAKGRFNSGDHGAEYMIRVKCAGDTAAKLLSPIDGIMSVKDCGSSEPETVDIMIVSQTEADVREEVFRVFAEAGCPILLFEPAAQSLEELFMQAISSDNGNNGESKQTAKGEEENESNIG